ncbi:MAG: M16 family metallopeptidase [Bacteroidales bacterium]
MINRHTLANGLTLLHEEDTSTQMVAVNVLYNVGSKDEHPERTGFAHLFEHLMFGGSVNIPDYDRPLQDAGGENNAWTSNDCTNYYCITPKSNVETAFWLESDRMLGLAFSQQSLDVQKSVVIEEFKQRVLNQPYGDMPLLIRPMAYKVHPYQWATIGKTPDHIEEATLEEVQQFFYKHYAPNNAILSVVGHITFEEAIRLTDKWFAGIERREVTKRALPAEPEQTEARFEEVYRDVPQSTILKAYHMCARTAEDYQACDVLSDILANGRSARLFNRLVMEKQLFIEANAYITGDIEDGLFFVTGKPVPGLSLEEADRILSEELETLTRECVSEYELQKVVNKFESGDLFSNINYASRAFNIAYYELFSEAEEVDREVSKYLALTPEKIREVAGKIFRPENCSTLYYRANSTRE